MGQWTGTPGFATTARPDLGAVDEHGSTRLPFLDDGLVDELRFQTSVFWPDADGGFVASPAAAWGERASGFQQQVAPLIRPALHAAFPAYRPFFHAATVKGPGGGPIPFHQDWTYTDERVARALFVWIPLVAVDEHNGALEVVPGSHRWGTGTIRPSRGMHAEHVTEHHQATFRRLAEGGAMRPGDALVFDPACLHGSNPNRSAEVRPSLTVGLVPVGVPLIHFHQTDDGDVSGHEVDDEFFVANPYASRPDRPATVRPWARCIAIEDFDHVGPRDPGHEDRVGPPARPAP